MKQNNYPSISVIIPCKGHAEELRACLTGLHHMDVQVPYETIVVDSNFDPTVRYTVQHFPNIKVIQSKENLNAGPARNLGVTQAAGDFLAFIDADCTAGPGWRGRRIWRQVCRPDRDRLGLGVLHCWSYCA